MRHLFILLSILLLLISGCSKKNVTDTVSTTEHDVDFGEMQHKSGSLDVVKSLAKALDDRQLAAQVIISGIEGRGQLSDAMKLLLEECPAGGVMLFRYNLDTDNDAIQNLLAETAALIGAGSVVTVNETSIVISPFIAADHEGGLVNRFRPGVADLPPPGSYWETAQEKSKETAIVQINTDSVNAGISIKRLGVNMNLAPVVEYLNDNNRDFLDTRSYGPDSAFVTSAAAAFIAGMEQAGILCVLKHFPGSAGADPHYHLSVLNGDKAALAKLVAPFTALIRGNRARAVMVSHSLVLALDNTIASLSPVIMGGWLRQELGFTGIIICDDFLMAAASAASASGAASAVTTALTPEDAAVLSLAAGADMVLVWPQDLQRTHQAIMAALDSGSLSRERLRDAAARIIGEKLRMELVK